MTSTRISAELTVTPIFTWNHEDRVHRVKINQGGTSSGKTYNILLVIFMRLLEKKRIATVIGQDIPNLKKGALRDFEDRILVDHPWLNYYIVQYHKTERYFKLRNGSKLEFTSFSDAQDARSGKRNIAFFNEANGITWPIYQQVALRTTEEIYLDYNPSSPFWAHERLMGNPGVVTYYSNFTHNPYISDVTRDYIIDLKYTDLEAWKVYGLGKTGTLSEVCIENMTVVDTMPTKFRRWGWGIDFGYRADPTTLIMCGLKNERDLYFDEHFYLRRMKPRDIALSFSALGVSKRRKIIADGADSRACDDLKERGYRIVEVTKGPQSVQYGLQLLNQYNIHVTARSLNMISERSKYRYKMETKGDNAGMITNEPIKAFDHTWDAARYWSMMNVKPIRKISHQWSGMTI